MVKDKLTKSPKSESIKNCYKTCLDNCKYKKKKSPSRCKVDCTAKCVQSKNYKAHGKLVRPVPRRQWSRDLPRESEEFSSGSTSDSDSSNYTSTSSSSTDSMNNYYHNR